jgi:thioredoxin reductase (NADPH)
MSGEFLGRLQEAGIPVLQTKVASLAGDGGLERVVMDSGEHVEAQGLFIAMGQASSSDFAYSLGLLRNGQFIDTDREQRTNIPGVFAAGDCVGRFLQISVAVGEGALAGRAAISHVKERRRAALTNNVSKT